MILATVYEPIAKIVVPYRYHELRIIPATGPAYSLNREVQGMSSRIECTS